MWHRIVLTCFILVSIVAKPKEPGKAAGGTPDPKAIVQKSAEAMEKLKVVAYDLEYKATGFFQYFLPNVSGRVVMGKEAPDRSFHGVIP